MNKKQKVLEIKKIFEKLYPNSTCSLNYQDPFELLVAVQLSAQCTDARVNMVTPELFAKYPTPESLANAEVSDIERIIHPLGFYKNKAKNLVNCGKRLIEHFDGKVPDNMDDLLSLSGVGRKTANLILGDVYGKPAIVTDTHAMRLSRRIGLTKNTTPEKIEDDLRKIVPPDYSSVFCHQLVHHGRAVCNARKPKCDECGINHICDKKLV